MAQYVVHRENMNDLNDRTNMIVMLIVVGTLTAAAIAMLLSVPSILRSNTPNIIGGETDDILTGGEGANRFICGGGEDTITDYNEAEGDTKTADCENF
jgi:Ca2+-binding RTX toxin-like protein